MDVLADGTQMVTGGRMGRVLLWDCHNLRVLREFSGHLSYVHNVCVSPNQKSVLTVCDDSTARLWDTSSGEILLELKHPDAVSGGIFSSSGDTLVTWSDGMPHFFDAEGTNKPIAKVAGTNLIAPPPWDTSTGQEILGPSFDSLEYARLIMAQGRVKDVIDAYERTAETPGITSNVSVVRDLYAWTMRWEESADLWLKMTEDERLSWRQIHRQMVLSYLVGDDEGFQEARDLALADVEQIWDTNAARHLLKGVIMKPLGEKDFIAVEKLVDRTASEFASHAPGAAIIWLAAYRLGNFKSTWDSTTPRPVASRTVREILARCLWKHQRDADASSAMELTVVMHQLKTEIDQLAASGDVGPYWWDYGESQAILQAGVDLLRETGFVTDAMKHLDELGVR
jgi:hypothetical protein